MTNDGHTSAADLIQELRRSQEHAADRYDALWHEKALVEAELARVRTDLAGAQSNYEQALRMIEAEVAARSDRYNTTKAQLIKTRRYIMRHDLQIGECVAWNALKAQFSVGEDTEKDDDWLAWWTQAMQPRELFPPPPATAEEPDQPARKALGIVGKLKRLMEDGRP
jgi:hypothetical protein